MPAEIMLDSRTVGVSATYYREQLRLTNPAEFALLTRDQQALIHERLVTTLLLLRVEAEEHLNRKRFHGLHTCRLELEQCMNLLNLLDATPPRGAPVTLAAQLSTAPGAVSASPLTYTFLLARLDLTKRAHEFDPTGFSIDAFRKEVEAFATDVRLLEESRDPKEKLHTADQLGKIRRVLARRNDERREWWVWGTSIFGVIDQLLAELSPQFTLANRQARDNVTGAVAPTMGIISWLLYYFRGMMDLGEAVYESWHHHRPDNIRSGVTLKDEGFFGRLGAQFSKRKFSLLNDFLWGTCNALCYFVLVGSMRETLGQWNYILTLVLLVGDTLATLWRYYETRQAHKAVYADLNRQETEILSAVRELAGGDRSAFARKSRPEQRYELDQMLFNIQSGQSIFDEEASDPSNENYQRYLYWIARYQDVQKARQKEKFDWHYQQRQLFNELAFTLNLVAGFSMMCSFFYNGAVSPLGQAIMSMVGASFCFLATVAFNAAIVLIERSRINASIHARETQVENLLEKFNDRKTSPEEKQLLFLQMKSQIAHTEYERELAAYHLKCAPLKTLIEILAPATFFFMVHFVMIGTLLPPVAMVIGMVALSAAIVYASRRLMRSWEPAKPTAGDERFFPTLKGNIQLEAQCTALMRRNDVRLEDLRTPAISGRRVARRAEPPGERDPLLFSPGGA